LAGAAGAALRPLSAPAATTPPPGPDLAEVIGQAAARRALEVAAAGGHHLLIVGPPGAGKSMLAARLPGILPPMTASEALACAAVLSLSKGGFSPAMWQRRPFRAPHHSASAAALIGGGNPPQAGEITLAHLGVLFLDEFIIRSKSPGNAARAAREWPHHHFTSGTAGRVSGSGSTDCGDESMPMRLARRQSGTLPLLARLGRTLSK